ncbi:hypothetical protein [Streptomyces hainanensis]|uniref:Ribbon-helix-helix protein, CopG family n=1 Tax=Streptomyces hainanensis TaxID=402648 RepID=A0A4R4TIM0_9ACTN|nr:hypothetical protein [Streptomyces hainanensis]TDC77460.1 hypothetical protein E1283_07300 [Streptomyces hainanensis]
MSDVMIRVPDHVRDRLALLAEARGVSIRSLVQEFAESTLTPKEREDRAERTHAYLAEHFGVHVTTEDSERMRRKIQDAFASRSEAAA